MQKFFSIFLALLLVLSNFFSLVSFAYTSTVNPTDPSTAPDSQMVTIPDSNLQKRLNELIALTNPPRGATDPISVGQLRVLTNLYGQKTLGNKSITNIEGLQYLFGNQNNQQFYLNTNAIVDLAPISDLSVLEKLVAHSNQVTAIPSNNWSNLTELDLSRNKLTDLTHLSTISKLKIANLFLNDLRAADLQPLTTVKNTLENLNLSNNYLQDLTVLGQLTKLKVLELNNSKSIPRISNIAPLATLVDLETLKINANALVDISPLQHMNKLKNLELVSNRISDISPLLGLNSLTTLKLNNNQISDLSSLNALWGSIATVEVNGQLIVFSSTQTSPLFENPIKGFDGAAIPIAEVAGEVINADSAGNPNQNGGYIKLLKRGVGTQDISWQKNYSSSKTFSGKMKVSYNIDPSAPVISFVTDIPNKPEQAHKISIKVEDTNLDINSLKYGYSTTASCDGTVSYSNTFTSEVEFQLTDATQNGKYLCVVAKDDVGNTTYLASAYPVNIDTTAPNAVISGDPAPGTRTNQKVVLTLIVNEEVQDITGWVRDTLDTKKFAKDITQTGTEMVSFYDIAGNLSAPVSYIVANIDKIGPSFTPSVASGVVSRKGVPINLNDITAADETGGSGLSGFVEMNTGVINLDPSAPVSGDYVLTYTARDHAGNQSTLIRTIQITDADQLSGEIQRVTPALLNGKTVASVQAVNTAKANAETVYNNPNATQLQIDQAKQALAIAIGNLQVQSSTSNTSRGGGGARLIMDHCPNGDYSPSYYDNSCGNIPDEVKQQPQPVQNQDGDPQGITNPEILGAYEWALKEGITTQSPIVNARLLDHITRAELAKMLSVFTQKYTEKKPQLGKVGCEAYQDLTETNAELVGYIKTACELEIMGLHSDGKTPLEKFMPDQSVSRAELVTVLSRILYGNSYDTGDSENWWSGHMKKMSEDQIVKDTTPTIQEIRARVLLMLFRIKGNGSIITH